MRKKITVSPKYNNLKSVFELGHGKVLIGYAEHINPDGSRRCSISFQNSPKTYKVGEIVTDGSGIEGTESFIFINSIASLEELQRQLEKCREFLIKNEL